MLKTIFVVLIMVVSLLGSYFVAKHNWKRYEILYFSSSLVGIVLCYLFVLFGLYVFPFRLIPAFPIPLLSMLTILPFIVITSVHFSPTQWSYKIPFYWAVVHTLMFFEVLALFDPLHFIEYKTNSEWDVWDSYTWWWIYLLIFEYVGGIVVPSSSRKAIDSKSFRYGKLVWMIVHFILILTIFLAGVYVGNQMK